MFDWRRNQVCLAEGSKDAYALLAIRPERLADEGGDGEETVVWDDGSRQRAFPVGRVLEDEPERFRFEDDRGQAFTLRPLTARPSPTGTASRRCCPTQASGCGFGC